MKRGALHDPNSAALQNSLDFNSVRVGAALPKTDWFSAWNWQPDGDVLGNDELSCCCEVADLRLIQGWKAAQGIMWPVPVDLVRLRYAAVGGWLGTPETDGGTVPAEDCFDWQSAPIVADGLWRVRWCSVRPEDVLTALRRGPLQLTIGLTAEDADDPVLWHDDADGDFTEFHRVVCGAEHAGFLDVLTYGFRTLVARPRVVAADLLLHVDTPADLRTAGIDWNVLTA